MICDARKPPGPELLAGFDPVKTAAEGDWYDAEAAEKAVGFIQRLKFTRGHKAGERFILEDWQAAYVRTLFGWKRANGTRRFRVSYFTVARKNGKTALIAAIAAYVLFCEQEGEAECYCAASSRPQATLVFRQAEGFIRNSPLEKRCKITATHKTVETQGRFFRAIPANEGSAHGYDSHLIIGDELHAWHGREFYDVLHTSTGARMQPIEIYITTAGYDRQSVCFEQYERAKGVRDGKIRDHTFLPLIYEASPEDDWHERETWLKANPNLGVSVDDEYLARECEEAKRNKAYTNTFLRLHLNIWTSAYSRWLPMDKWRACPVDVDYALDPGRSFGGLDMANTSDFCAFLAVQREGETVHCRGHYWLPEEKAEEYRRRYNWVIDQWIADGWLTMCPGASIDQSCIETHIRTSEVKTVGYDRWETAHIKNNLAAEGHEMIEVGQGYASLSAPCKTLERLILSGNLEHGGDPILEMMAENAVAKYDENKNVKPVKDQSQQKIDGIVALLMAIRVLDAKLPNKPSIYETPGMLSLS